MPSQVTLSEATAADVTATWTASIESGDTAEAEDLGSTTGMVTVTASQTTATFTVLSEATDDTTDREEDETFTLTLTLSSPSNATLAADPTATGTIADDDQGICNRTPRVRDRILTLLKYRHSFKGGCGDVDEPHLAKLQSLDLGRNPSTESAFTMSLRSHDFEGLVNLERLYMRETGLSSLPAGVFSGLAALETLELDNNRLLSLPAGVFSDLLNLKTLELHRNELNSLPYDEFEALPNLTELRVDPEGRRGYQVAGGEGDVTLEVAAGGTTTYQVRLTHRPAYLGTANLPTLTVSSDTAGVTASPTTLQFTKENWFRRQTVTLSATTSAAGATATLTHTSTAVAYDRPTPKVTVRVLENAPGRTAEPLTATFEGVPARHDGETAFTFRIVFSEAVTVTPEAMRTHALTVEGGAVTGAARVDRESGVWAITVTPDTREALSISLTPASDCEADGAVCTSDGRALSNGTAHIVIGPGPETETQEGSAPARPTGLTAEVSHDSVTLTWDDPGDDSITGYQVLRRDKAIHEEGTFETVESDTALVGTTYTDVTAEPEKQYVYRIKAINADGLSEISSWVRAYTPAAPAPEPTPEPTPEPESVSEGDSDLPNDNSTPGRVAVGGSATGAIGTAGDQDRFAVDLEAGRTYRFDLTGSPGGGGTLPDTFFRAIYNSEGRYQPDSYNDDFDGGRDSRVTFTPSESGTYYARVSGDRDEVGSYTLSVTDVTQ